MMKHLKTALLLLTFVATTSCLKPPSLSDDNGPEVPADEVQKAILTAWDNADFNSIRLNEYLYYEQDQKISTLDPKVVYKEASQVIERTETADSINYKFLIRSQAFENGSFKPITSLEDNISAAKTTPSQNETVTASSQKAVFPESVEALQKSMAEGSVGLRSGKERNHYLGVLTVQNMLAACVKAEGWDVSCHNLQVTTGKRAAPTGVASTPGCGGIPNCEISYTKIAFDLVVNLKDANTGNIRPEKVAYELVISPDVPYLSRLLDFCYQGMVQVPSQKVLVKICNKVQNFTAGQ